MILIIKNPKAGAVWNNLGTLIVLTIRVLQHVLSLEVLLAAASPLWNPLFLFSHHGRAAVPWPCSSVISEEQGGSPSLPRALHKCFPCLLLGVSPAGTWGTSDGPSPAVTAVFFCPWNESSAEQIWRDWVPAPYLWLLPNVSLEPFPAQP